MRSPPAISDAVLLFCIFLQLCRCCFVEHPGYFSPRRVDNLCRIFIRLIFTFKYGLYSICFLSTCDQEENVVSGIQDAWCECEPLWWRLWHCHRHDQALLFM